jgi:hypothetical protein
MPDLMTSTALKGATTTSQFHFSGQKVAELQGASEYTLACIAVDRSGSVGAFKTLLEKAYATAVKACRKSPRAHNLLLRGATFSDDVAEMHGFVALSQLDEDKVAIDPDGYTALYDATLDGIESIEGYADTLVKNDFFVNGILVIVTDGGENHSRKATLAKIRAALTRVGKAEKLESLKTILIGVGDQASVKAELENFQKDAGLDQFIWVGDATPQRLAKMAEFVSKSISSASLSLGTGGPSQNLSLN